MKKIIVFTGFGLALGCAGILLSTTSICTADTPPSAGEPTTATALDGLKFDAGDGRCLEIKGTFETAIQIVPPFPSFPPDPFQPILHLLITAKGNVSHLGNSTAATTDEAIDLSLNPNRGTGRWIFQNANGDAIWTELDLTSTPPDPTGRTTFQGTLTVIGGSGKFVGATGRLLGEGFAVGSSGAFSITGTVCVNRAEDK